MARVLDEALDALIESKTVRQVFTLDVQLPTGEELHLSTGALTLGGVQYSPLLAEPGLRRFSLFADDDMQDPKVSNVDYEFGQTLTGAVNILDGARATSGCVFVSDETAEQWYDEHIPGLLTAGQVTEKAVDFELVDDLYATVVAGERVVDIHPFRQPAAPSVRPDPNDNTTGPTPIPGTRINPYDDPEVGPGRYPYPVDWTGLYEH